MKFSSSLKSQGLIKLSSTTKISQLPQLYRASMEFARSQGSSELNRILDQFKLSGKYKYVSIDTRSHMLMTGMYPCIPGWHCDDFYRPSDPTLHGQPDLEHVEEKAPAVHHMLIIGDCSRTEFLVEDIPLPDTRGIQEKYGTNEPVYFHYDRIIELATKNHHFHAVQVEPNTMYTFGPTAFHRGMPATHNGWRYFIRITESDHREPKDEVRYQTQVYSNGRVSW
jgi:hypothetical protein